jgi:hypothetical protein
MLRYMVLGGLLTLMLFPIALGELTSFKLIYGGSGLDAARDIYVDSSGIYMVGVTSSFGGNPPNAYLTIFNTDNTHRCSVAVDLTGNEEGVGVAVHAGKVYLLGRTSFGSNPPNFFIAVFNATTCSFQTSMLYDLGPGEIATGIAVEPAATPAFYVSGFGSGIGGSFIMKLDSSLNPVWTVGYKVRSANDIASDLVFSGGRIYVVGAADYAGDLNMYLTIFNSAGSHVATRELASSSPENAQTVAISGSRIYIAGFVDYPGRGLEVVVAALDTSPSPSLLWAKIYGTAASHEIGKGLAVAGGLIYVTGHTTVFGSPDVLLTAFTDTGAVSHSFAIAGAGAGFDEGNAAHGLGSCVFTTGISNTWPMVYAVVEGELNNFPVTVSPITPSTTSLSPSSSSVSPSLTGFTPAINSLAGGDAFYSKFCPDSIVSSTTTTVTTTTGVTTTATTTLTTTSTAYAIATTTVTSTQVSTLLTTLTLTSSTTSTERVTTTQTTTQTLSTTQTRTETTTQTIQTTQTFQTTQTYSTTATSTVLFAEPFTNYMLPLIIVFAVALVGAAAIFRRRQPTPPPQRIF